MSLKEIIQATQGQFQWEFLYVAVNQDAILKARKMGSKEDAKRQSIPVGVDNCRLSYRQHPLHKGALLKGRFAPEPRRPIP